MYIGVRNAEGKLLGGVGGVRIGDTFVSGFSAPFGGIDLVDEHETADNISCVVGESMGRLRAEGIGRIQLRLPPAAYSENESMVQFCLLNAGFQIERCELNQHIPISDWASIEDYQAHLRPAAQKTLRYLRSLDLTFRPVEDDEAWDRAHALLAANRARKGRQIALSADYVRSAREQLRPHVRMFELTLGTAPIAAALVYAVTPRRSLVVAWGEAEHQLKRSPMILLAAELVGRCLAEKIELLDLGISNEPEVPPGAAGLEPNYGLTQFKRSTLAQIQPRFLMTWSRS
jgi:hypothetical protein